jgi:hypothetical protein
VPLQTRALRTTGFDEGVSYHPRRIQLKLPATIGSVTETVSFPCLHRRFDPTLRFRLCGFHQSVSQFVVGRLLGSWPETRLEDINDDLPEADFRQASLSDPFRGITSA